MTRTPPDTHDAIRGFGGEQWQGFYLLKNLATE
jgi:hypothetical protein